MNNKYIKELKLIENITQNGTIYYKDNLLYKIINDPYFFPEEVLRNIDYQINNPIPNTPRVYDKIYIDNMFSGYIMEYINNSYTFKQAINNNISINNKIKTITDIYQGIKYLHNKNILLGDIHLDNLLLNNNKGYIIDLDYIIFPQDTFKFNYKYQIKLNNNTNKYTISTKYTDNLKALISSLSLLLNIDLERYIDNTSKDINIEYIYNTIIKKYNNSILNKYLEEIILGNTIPYFDDYLLSKNNKIKKLSLK